MTGRTVSESRYAGHLREAVLLFLRLGATAWGGPAAATAIMYQETVKKHGWLTEDEFLDLVGATNLIPGANAVEMAIHLGLKRAGWWGFLTAGAAFILPGTAMTVILAWFYVTYGALPQVGWVLYGVKPVVIGIIAQALWRLGSRRLRRFIMAAVAAATLVLYLAGLNEIILLFGGAAVPVLIKIFRSSRRRRFSLSGLPFLTAGLMSYLPAGAAPFSLDTLFLSFLKIGAVLYGTGYVLIAFLRSEFVVRLGWLTGQELLDAIAVGQTLPGPLSKSATFVGYLLGGLPGAVLATLGMFLPSFLLVAGLSRILGLVRRSQWAAAFMDGVNAASLGLMAGALVELGRGAVVDPFAVLMVIASLVLTFRFRVSFIWLILGGGVTGLLYRLVTG